MLKKVLLGVIVLSFAVACGGKNNGGESKLETIKQSVSIYSEDFCGKRAFVATQKQLDLLDEATVNGDVVLVEEITEEVIIVFSREEPSYKALLAERKRTSDLHGKLNEMDKDPSNSGMKWKDTKTKARKHLINAKAAADSCDTNKAVIENNRAQDTLGISNASQLRQYTVIRGDNLWNISKRELRNPYIWPVIYWGNKAQIKDPDLIFPGQAFGINNSYSTNDKRKASKFARTRGKWSLYDNK